MSRILTGYRRALSAAVGAICCACTHAPQLDFSKRGALREPRWCGLGNFAVVHIDPNGRDVTYHWKAFNKHHGNAFNVPFEEITLTCDDETYVITDRDVGNGALKVNDRVYRLTGDRPTLVIRCGAGLSCDRVYPYEQAHHWYDPF